MNYSFPHYKITKKYDCSGIANVKLTVCDSVCTFQANNYSQERLCECARDEIL